ncbi:MAG TPA: Rne/Rng family ribonuclease [Terracidiphilus sp.]|nr:Rne/Rng family ribonuclease [Terracidiphilus sp.]
MAKEICISSTPHETRLAILEDDQLAEIYYERENEYTLAGSIYNGRVTRVLPGMQSAFVDLGLERDAFLYVTDFLELEDQEESEELEKAAVAGGNQAPREVHHVAERGPRESRPEPRPDRNVRDQAREAGRDRRPAPEHALEIEPVKAAVPPSTPATAEEESGEPDEGGAKRWRGRRRRRGGRGAAQPVADPVETESSSETYLEPAAEPPREVPGELHAGSGEQHPPYRREASAPPARPSHTPREQREAVPFVLPGESLSKYGGEPAPSAPAPQSSAPSRRGITFHPSTMVEAPLTWDGSGLLPGESLARHRGRQPGAESAPAGSAQIHGEPQGVFSDAAGAHEYELEETTGAAPEADGAMESSYLNPAVAPFQTAELVEEELVEEEQPQENLPGAPAQPAIAAVDADPFSDPFFIQSRSSEASQSGEGYEQEEHTGQPHGKPADQDYGEHKTIEEPSTEVVADWIVPQKGDPDRPGQESGGTQPDAHDSEPEADRSASHNVDPLPPSEFRLFGIGGKKKKDEHPEYPSAVKVPPPGGSVATASSFAPGHGVVEEETIEGEEFDAPRQPHHRHDEHDLDDYEEEEKLHTQIRSGELGEMLQEAHLDHKIQQKFEDKNGEDEDIEIEEEEDEEEGAEGQPSADGAPAPSRERRERGGRGRRERGGRPPQGNRRGGPSRRSAQTSDLPIISDLLKPGQEILVQIAKEPIAKKGARITSHIALPGRFLVFMPTVTHVGVSRKIASDEERQRLKRILTSERGDASGGFIVRTAAEGASEEELRADLRFLIHLWDEIKDRSEKSKSPALIYHDLSLIERILRDQVSANFSAIWVDSQDDYERIVRFLNRFSPNLVRRVKLYTKETPLFEHFGIQDEISKALRSKVWLKSGGSIVINQTEALVAIDINTGKYVGKTARLEDTIVKTNLDAIPEIVRQIRLRDLGGIIIIDFIDMDERKNRFRVMAALEEALKNDRAPTKVLQFNDFGLVAITRKRVKQSLERTLSVPCPTCQATGMVKSPATVCNEIYTELRKMRKHFENADVLVRVNPETVKALKSNNARWLTEFEDLTGKNILVKSDATLHPEQFDIQG